MCTKHQFQLLDHKWFVAKRQFQLLDHKHSRTRVDREVLIDGRWLIVRKDVFENGTCRLTDDVPRFELKYRATDTLIVWKVIYGQKALEINILDRLSHLKSIAYR